MGENRKERRLALERQAKTGEPYHVALAEVRRQRQAHLVAELLTAPQAWQNWVRQLAGSSPLRASDVSPLAGVEDEPDLLPGTPEFAAPQWSVYCEGAGPGPKSTHHIGYDGAIEVAKASDGLSFEADSHGGIIWRTDATTFAESVRSADGKNALRCVSCGSWIRIGPPKGTGVRATSVAASVPRFLGLDEVYDRMIHAGEGNVVLVRAEDPETGPYSQSETVPLSDVNARCASGWRRLTIYEEEQAFGDPEDYGSSERH